MTTAEAVVTAAQSYYYCYFYNVSADAETMAGQLTVAHLS